MTSQEIRNYRINSDFRLGADSKASLLREIAAQLADINEYLRGVAPPKSPCAPKSPPEGLVREGSIGSRPPDVDPIGKAKYIEALRKAKGEDGAGVSVSCAADDRRR